MKTNPFYALSVSAMLLGCWLLSEALHLQAGRLGGLLVLMSVLQIYEGLLVGLGTFLVRTGRAPRDGATVLVLESLLLIRSGWRCSPPRRPGRTSPGAIEWAGWPCSPR